MITAALGPQDTLIKLDRLPKALEKEALTGVRLAALFMGDEIAKSITTGQYGVKTDTGRLRSSFAKGHADNVFSLTAFPGGVLGIIGSNVKYAPIQERGGKFFVNVSKKMSKFFWAMWYKTKDDKFKASALKKGRQVTIKIPPHYYMRNTMLAKRVSAAKIFWQALRKEL